MIDILVRVGGTTGWRPAALAGPVDKVCRAGGTCGWRAGAVAGEYLTRDQNLGHGVNVGWRHHAFAAPMSISPASAFRATGGDFLVPAEWFTFSILVISANTSPVAPATVGMEAGLRLFRIDPSGSGATRGALLSIPGRPQDVGTVAIPITLPSDGTFGESTIWIHAYFNGVSQANGIGYYQV